MPIYEVVTPLRRNRKTVPPGETVTLDEGAARELLRKGAIVPARVAVKPPPPPPPPPPAKAKAKPAKPDKPPKPATKAAAKPDDDGGGGKLDGEAATPGSSPGQAQETE